MLKNKRTPTPARCSCLVPVFLTVPSAGLWRTTWSPSGTGWLSQGMRSQSWGLSMFPVFCHLRDPDLTGSSVPMKERRLGDSHID